MEEQRSALFAPFLNCQAKMCLRLLGKQIPYPYLFLVGAGAHWAFYLTGNVTLQTGLTRGRLVSLSVNVKVALYEHIEGQLTQ